MSAWNSWLTTTFVQKKAIIESKAAVYFFQSGIPFSDLGLS